MTRTQKIAYGFFAQTIVLLLLYAAAALLSAVKFLRPDDPLTLSLPYSQIGGLANVLLNLAALTGLIGGGIYMLADQRANTRLADENSLIDFFWLWALLLIAVLFAGTFNQLEGRSWLELPPSLDIMQAIIVARLLVSAILNGSLKKPAAQIWTLGLAFSEICSLIGLIQPADYLQDRALRALAAGVNANVAYPLMTVALGFWLLRRFSNVPADWADTGVYSVAGMVTLAGMLVSVPPFYALGAPGWAQTIGSAGVIIAPTLYLIFAAHSYRALSDRSSSQTLAAHWFALSLLLFLLGPGLLGALQAAPGISQWTLGTRLTDLLMTLTLLASLCMALAVINQGAAELRGQNRRVTGFIPFWLIAFGSIGGALALGGAGLVQIYLERIMGAGYLDTQTLLRPLYAAWTAGLVSLAVGAGIYALTFWRRRPVETRN